MVNQKLSNLGLIFWNTYPAWSEMNFKFFKSMVITVKQKLFSIQNFSAQNTEKITIFENYFSGLLNLKCILNIASTLFFNNLRNYIPAGLSFFFFSHH